MTSLGKTSPTTQEVHWKERTFIAADNWWLPMKPVRVPEKYVMQDEKGSTRALMNNNGSSSSVIARHDYLPFGEEIASGIGLRTSGQGFAATDTNRQKYAMTERDDVTDWITLGGGLQS